MRSIIFTAIIIMIVNASMFGQTIYYISNSGNDANSGLSETTAFGTIDKINTIVLKPGDQILFRRGDIFRGTLNIKQSGNTNNLINIDTYGTGDKPIISGSTLVTTWTNIGTNLWQATCSSCGEVVTGLYDNSTSLPLGRYPNLNDNNKGYLTIQSHANNNQFVSQQPLTTDWTGGEVVYRPVLWILNRATITQQSGNTLTINNSSSIYGLADGWGYFIQNHPATLDLEGEWYYNPTNKTLRLFSTQNPNSKVISATVYSHCINILNVSYVSVKNIYITQSLNIGLYAANSSSITVSGVDIVDSGEDGVAFHGNGSNVLIENTLIERPNNNGIEIQVYSNSTLRNNSIKKVALIPGRGKTGDGQYRAVDVGTATNILIENNKLDSLGYSGITFSPLAAGAVIRKNVISNYCYTKSDGGGIYTFNGSPPQAMSNIKIQSNIIYKALAAPEGAPVGVYSGSNGIYMDNCTQNVEISNNTVFSCYGIGIFLIATNNMTVTQNTSYDNGEGQFVLTFGISQCPDRTNTIKNNIFIGKNSTQSIARYESSQNDLDLYGDIDANYYARPLDDAIKIGAAFTGVNYTYGLKNWQSLFGKDINSKESPVTYTGFTVNSINGVNRISNGTFDANVSEWYPQSPYYNNGINEWDNTNKLDGGSMRIYFQPASGYKGSFVIVFHGVNNIVNGKSYVLRFDAVASANGKTLQTFIRERYGPTELSVRVGALVGTTRKRYEIAFTAKQDNADALLIFQALEDGESVWLDNISFQEATITRTNPDDLTKIVYNTSQTDSIINLDGNYRDVKNQLFTRQISLSSFTSAVLLRDTAAAVDLRLTLQAEKDVSATGIPITLSVRIRNVNQNTGVDGRATAVWVCRLPPNVVFINGAGITNTNGVLSAQVNPINAQSESVFSFQIQLTAQGSYQFASEILTSSRPDPTSTPGSGTGDGEDDTSIINLRTPNFVGATYMSPNPNQRSLPPVIQTQPSPIAGKADLSLAIALSNHVFVVNQIISCTIAVANMGANTASGVQVKNTLPAGFQFVDGTNWSANGLVLTGNYGTIITGTINTLQFRMRATSSGSFTNLAEIIASSLADPDSTVGNGTLNGEDDRVQADLRVK